MHKINTVSEHKLVGKTEENGRAGLVLKLRTEILFYSNVEVNNIFILFS